MNERLRLNPALDLILERVVPVRPELVWTAWTEPKHLMQWFTPLPWLTIACEIDARPGGIFSTTMKSPDGRVLPPTIGCYLEVVHQRKLTWTDALGPGYRPNARPFMTACILFEPEGTGTRYVAIAMHHDEAGRQKHEELGFHRGWSTALDQLVAHMQDRG